MAAAISTASDTMSTIKQSVNADHTIQFITPTGVAAGETITYAFPTGFTLLAEAVNNFDFAVSAAGSCASFTDKALALTASGATWGLDVTSQTITVTSGTDTIAAGRCVQLEAGTVATDGTTGAANTIVNQTAVQNTTDAKIVIDGSMVDTGTIAVEIVTDNTLAVTATVDPSITCAVDGNIAQFGTFVTSTVDTASQTPIWTISTNANTGYNLSVKSAGNATNAGLYSSSAAYVIKSADGSENSTADLSVAATIGYGMQASKANGDAGSAASTISSPYTSTSDTVGRLQLTAQTVSSAGGPVSNATVTTTLKAKVTGLVPPGAYVDTLTYVCSGIY